VFLKKMKEKIKGFTLVELLAVIVILAIIMIIAIPSVLSVLTTARKKSFVEYVDKAVGVSKQKYMEGVTLGESANACYIYVVEKDLGIDNTGDYKGFVLVAPAGNSNYQYWVLLHDNEFFLDTINYEEFSKDATSKLNDLPEKVSDLDIQYFANALSEKGVSCSTFKYGEGSIEPSDSSPGGNEGTTCEGLTVKNTIPKNATGLYRKIAEKSYLDNASSKYVDECSGINFKLNSGTYSIYSGGDYIDKNNGIGVYEMASTKDDNYPIYYFRGDMNDYASKEGTANNAVFGGSCWKIIRTTSTGGVKMIYNGPYSSGKCGQSNLGRLEYNPNSSSALGDASYMYGKRYVYDSKSLKNSKALFGDTVTYSNGTYKLAGDTVMYDDANASALKDEVGKQYTCFNESGECSEVYYVFKVESYYFTYLTFTGGEKLIDAMHNSFDVNTVDSTAKKTVDNWFAGNMVSYQSYLEDTPYCNDRRYYSYGPFNEKYKIFAKNPPIELLTFAGNERGSKTGKVSLTCEKNDAFTVSSSIGNGALKYPVGLITYDEVVLAGGSTGWSSYNDYQTGGHAEDGYNSKYYLYDDREVWTMTPSYYGNACSVFSGCYGDLHSQPYAVSEYLFEEYYLGYVKPVISLKAGVDATGTGTTSDPYIIN